MSLVLRPDTEMSFDILSFITPPNGRPCHMYKKVERLQAKTRCPLVARHNVVTTNVVTASAVAAREGTEKERKIDWKVLQTKFVVILEQTWW